MSSSAIPNVAEAATLGWRTSPFGAIASELLVAANDFFVQRPAHQSGRAVRHVASLRIWYSICSGRLRRTNIAEPRGRRSLIVGYPHKVRTGRKLIDSFRPVWIDNRSNRWMEHVLMYSGARRLHSGNYRRWLNEGSRRRWLL